MIVDVALGMRAYPIHIAPGLLGAAAPVLGPFARNQRLVVVTDESVAALHLETLAAGLPSETGARVKFIEEPRPPAHAIQPPTGPPID